MNARRLPFILVAGILLIQAITLPGASRAGPVVSWGTELDTNARYLWRGLLCDTGPVFQPSAWAGVSRYTFSVWSSFSGHEELGPSVCKELDLSLQADLGNDLIGIQPSFLYYGYFDDGVTPATGELSIRVSRSIRSFEAYTNHTFDVVRYGGAYFGETGLAFESRIANGRLAFTAGLSAGWGSRHFNDVYLGQSRTALNLAASSIGIRYPAQGHGYIRGHMEGAAILDPAIRRELGSTQQNAGVAVGIEF